VEVSIDTFAPVLSCPSDTVITTCDTAGVVYNFGQTGFIYTGDNNGRIAWIDAETNTELGRIQLALSNQVYALDFHPFTGELYAVVGADTSSDRQLFTIDLPSGAMSYIGNTGYYISDISFSRTGRLYAVSGDNGPITNSLFRLDLHTGQASFLANVGSSGGHAISYNPEDGMLYHLYNCSDLEKIDLNNVSFG
jgi:hypothetical protein